MMWIKNILTIEYKEILENSHQLKFKKSNLTTLFTHKTLTCKLQAKIKAGPTPDILLHPARRVVKIVFQDLSLLEPIKRYKNEELTHFTIGVKNATVC